MTDLRSLAMGIYKIRQAFSPTDVICQQFVNTSIVFAEASMAHDPQRKERLAEFYKIAASGVLTD